MSELVHVDRRGQVLEITLDRPPVNAITNEISLALHAALQTLQDDDDLRVGIITGTGDRIFSAGWDLKEVAKARDASEVAADSLETPGGFAGICEYWALKKPLIAALNGHAVGGGLEIAIACDVIIAADHAEFFLPEMQRGFLPDAGAVKHLGRLIPVKVAVEMMLTGRHMSAQEAQGWGLVHDVAPAADLMGRARQMAEQIASGAPLTLQALKEVLYPMLSVPLPEAFAMSRRAISTKTPGTGPFPIYERMLASDDFLEGARAFADKREPEFKGS
ncbi:MAG: enoyl-CoA hydratase-related protein [Alphaproteobacteria bacterium]